MTQNLSFKENDTLHITITLPNGDVLEFEPYNQYTYFQGFSSSFLNSKMDSNNSETSKKIATN